MDLSLLKLKYLINQTNKSADIPFEFLENTDCPAVLIYDAALAKKILKSAEVAPLHLVNFWKMLCGIDENGIPAITQYFVDTPLLLDGRNHIDKRKHLLRVYSKVESQLDDWLPQFVADFFTQHANTKVINAPDFITMFVRESGRRMVQSYFETLQIAAPELPIEILHFVPEPDSLTQYDEPLGRYIGYLERLLQEHGLASEDSYPLMSIIVMGTEPIIAALCYAIQEYAHDADWNIHQIFAEASSVRVIARYAKSSIAFDELSFAPGQRIYLDVHQINRNAQKNDELDKYGLAFGYATHLCPGRNLSIKVATVFAKYWLESEARHHVLPFKFTRDLILRPIK